MKYLEYKEHRQQGTFSFPIAYYHIDPYHPRYQMPYHWHTECELLHIIKGKFTITLNGKSYNLVAGDMLFIQNGLLHGGIPDECTYECIVFDTKILFNHNDIFTKQIQKLTEHKILAHPILSHQTPLLYNNLETLFRSMYYKENGYEFLVLGTLYLFLGIILEHELYESNQQVTFVSHHTIPLKNVLEYLEQNYTEKITLNTLADVAGMNPKYFCRYFKSLTSRSPIDYLNYYRIECAREQLSTTDLPITEVAFNCGFNEVSYFIKTFKKYLGITPKQYMKTTY